MDWKVNLDQTAADATLAALEENVTSTGVEKVAAKAADELLQASHEAFDVKVDPIHGTGWARAAAATEQEKGFRSLLVRTGELEQALVSGYGLTPSGATAFLNVQSSQIGLALIHLYGVQAKRRRTYMRATKRGFRKESRRRLRPAAVLPARGFAGIPPGHLADLTAYAEEVMVP